MPARPFQPEVDTSFFGHPRGLATLFFTEMWERFSYYGMRALLMLFMVAPRPPAAWASSDVRAGVDLRHSTRGSRVGARRSSAAWIADRFLGQYRAVLLGGVVIAAGHFTLAFPALPLFYTGLASDRLRHGPAQAERQHARRIRSIARGDTRRDAGFSIFYMGINLGAFLGPLIAGYLAQKVNWHVGFACAGVGMMLGLVQYVAGRKRLQAAIDRLEQEPAAATASTASASIDAGRGFSGDEWKRIGAIIIFFMAATVFWGGYEQAGSTLNLFADRYTRLDVFGLTFPSSWFQSVPPFFVIVLAPVLRMAMGPPRPPSAIQPGQVRVRPDLPRPVLHDPDSRGVDGAERRGVRVSPWWLVASYFVFGNRRAVPEPHRPERRHQAGSGAHRRPDDGRLVPGERVRQQAGRMGGGLLQHDTAQHALYDCHGRAARGGGRDVRHRQAGKAAHG